MPGFQLFDGLDWQSLNGLEWWKVTLFISIVAPILTYALTTVKSTLALYGAGERKPPILPYWLPFLGNLIAANNPPKLASDITKRFGFSIPVRVRVGPVKGYLVSDPSHFETLLRGARNLNSTPGIILMLSNLFGLPKSAGEFYAEDNSGISSSPITGTSVAVHNRIGHLRHSAAAKYLYGPHLRSMTERFVGRFAAQIHENEAVGADWVEYPDLVDWLQRFMFRAATTSLCGPHIFRLNPGFTDDYWAYMSHVPALAKGFPRWVSPGAYRARDRCIRAIERWHKHAWANVDHARDDDSVEYEEYFGARIMRVRYAYAKKMDRMTDEARAAEDLAMVFAANANAVPAATWFIIEFMRDPGLLERVRAELDEARLPSPPGQPPAFDIGKLCEGVLLQSVWAETLRLRVAIALMRAPEKRDFRLGRWIFPRGDLIFLSSRTAAYNKDLWNEGGAGDPHPVEAFWADRFIVYPGDAASGPVRQPRAKAARGDGDDGDDGNTKPRFSLEGLAGGWVPFGGGVRMCPGRFFVKNEMMAAFALLCTCYKIELRVAKGWEPEPDMRFFATGSLPPKGKIPFRIRKHAF
ncbi:cytochrome P450 [Xylaria palmicola]|nr:cytochrome P450 [Xylaria palmicola]